MQLYGNINLRLNKSDKTDAICMQLPIDILRKFLAVWYKPIELTFDICLPLNVAPQQPTTTTKEPVTTNTTAAPTTTKAPVTTTKGTPSTASTSGSSVTRPVALLLAAMASAFLALF